VNKRERALTVLKGGKPDLVPWLGDLSYWAYWLEVEGLMPDKYKGKPGYFKLHEDLGVGFYLQGYFPFKSVYDGVSLKQETVGDFNISTLQTPIGDLICREKHLPESYCWAVEEHFIKTWKDLKIYRYWVDHTHYVPDYETARERYDLAGENGIVLCYLPKSPLMELVALQVGIANLTYIIADAPEEFEETMQVLGKKTEEAAEIALNSPAECLMIPENLSSEVVGKRLFNKYMRSYEERWTTAIRNAGKYSFVHVDGTLKGLIREVASSGFDVCEALTPAPVGDIPIGEMHAWTGEKTIVWGGIPGLYFTDLISDSEFDSFVISVLDVMKREPRFVLGVSDQVPPRARWERIQRVNQLVEQYGTIEW
jgi:hypothetical protein